MSTGAALKTNEDYHKNRTHLSSSILKLLLTDIDKFYEQWVLNLPQDTKPQFQEGSLTHALILEPTEVASRYAFYPGLRRVGKDYEVFAEANRDKEILLMSTKLKAQRSRDALHAMPTALKLIQNCEYEYNMISEIMGIPVKARADVINIAEGYILDVKTTSLPSDPDIFRQTVNEFMYNLSAALYCQIASSIYSKPFSFYWAVISKQDFQCHVYKASPKTLQLGTSLLNKALVQYKHFLSANSIDALRSTTYTTSTNASLYEVIEV